VQTAPIAVEAAITADVVAFLGRADHQAPTVKMESTVEMGRPEPMGTRVNPGQLAHPEYAVHHPHFQAVAAILDFKGEICLRAFRVLRDYRANPGVLGLLDLLERRDCKDQPEQILTMDPMDQPDQLETVVKLVVEGFRVLTVHGVLMANPDLHCAATMVPPETQDLKAQPATLPDTLVFPDSEDPKGPKVCAAPLETRVKLGTREVRARKAALDKTVKPA
jgi:hypothetical protein